MPGKVLLYAMAGLTVAVLFVLSLVHGHAPHQASDWLAPIGPAVTVAGVGVWLFDRYLWRWPGICRLVRRPLLHGTWHGELESDWVNPETSQRVPVDPDVFLVVRQRFWQLSARLLTRESSSASTLASLTTGPDGVQQFLWVYTNVPRVAVRERSEIHRGAVVLSAPQQPDRLEGEYFTDRKTRGELRLTSRYKKLIETHAEGLALLASEA
jgi:hypothetical protein